MTAAVIRDGIMPTQATTQPAALGGHGMPWHSGQCWVQSVPMAACELSAKEAEGIQAYATVGNAAANTARQPNNADRKRKRTIWP